MRPSFSRRMLPSHEAKRSPAGKQMIRRKRAKYYCYYQPYFVVVHIDYEFLYLEQQWQ